MRIRGKLCNRLDSTRKLRLENPTPVYIGSCVDEYILKRATENWLGEVLLSNSPEGVCFEMSIDESKPAGIKLKNAGTLGCSTLFKASGQGIGMKGLHRALNDNSVSSIIPAVIVLTDTDADADSEVEILP